MLPQSTASVTSSVAASVTRMAVDALARDAALRQGGVDLGAAAVDEHDRAARRASGGDLRKQRVRAGRPAPAMALPPYFTTQGALHNHAPYA